MTAGADNIHKCAVALHEAGDFHGAVTAYYGAAPPVRPLDSARLGGALRTLSGGRSARGHIMVPVSKPAIEMTRKSCWLVPARRIAAAGLKVLLLVTTLVVLGSSPVRALVGDLAAIKAASNLDQDPQDAQAVAAVCTVCHSASQFLFAPRASSRWEQVFAEMSGYGADGTDDQLDRVVSYFQGNLTVINVNTSPPEDLSETLQVKDEVVAAIMTRRAQRPFTGIDGPAKIRGVDRVILGKLSAKNCLQF
jgi:hypothetical protein